MTREDAEAMAERYNADPERAPEGVRYEVGTPADPANRCACGHERQDHADDGAGGCLGCPCRDYTVEQDQLGFDPEPQFGGYFVRRVVDRSTTRTADVG